ncbi:hypothetical protein COU89_02795, partial [Candidatus Roizmanbacteria bacterium CG10_big_fil_rev_8_21_14_0_10_45_7]
YYLIGAYVLRTFHTTKSLQFINPVIFFLLTAIVFLSAYHTFKNKYKSLMATFAFTALPMINIFPPMVTNEFLNTFCITASIMSAIFIATAKTRKQLIIALSLWLLAAVAGIYTKITILTALPAFFTALGIQLAEHKSIIQKKVKIILFILFFGLFFISSLPILSRKQGGESPSNIQRIATSPFKKDIVFFTRLDWIVKLDMFNAHYYSFLGGSWNSFWQDGHNA